MSIPFFILLAKQRAAAFRGEAELLVERQLKEREDELLDHLGGIVPRGESCDFPKAVEKALIWAWSGPLPEFAELREAKGYLDAGLSDWGAAWAQLSTLLPRVYFGERHWFREAVRIAAIRHHQASRSLEEGWPISSEHVEQQALADMKAGEFIELDDAFPGISGQSKEDWLQRSAKHKEARRPSLPGNAKE